MPDSTTRHLLNSISPFFIVSDLSQSVAFYRDTLDFELTFLAPEVDPFFAILRRDGVQVMIKEIAPDVRPLPNCQRHFWAGWDAFIHTSDPAALADEFAAKGVTFHKPLAETEDNLRGFELRDPNGYVLFFGHPI